MLQVLGRLSEVSSDGAASTAALLPSKCPRRRTPRAPCAALGAGGDGDGSVTGGMMEPGPWEDTGGHGRCWERSSALPMVPAVPMLRRPHRRSRRGGRGWAPAGLRLRQAWPGTRMTATISLLGGTERALPALLFFCLRGREEERLFL